MKFNRHKLMCMQTTADTYTLIVIHACTHTHTHTHTHLIPHHPCRELSDVDKDGRLNAEEFAIAMHLLEKAKAGLTLPATLPASLSPSTTKFNTLARSSPQSSR